jgi:transposase
VRVCRRCGVRLHLLLGGRFRWPKLTTAVSDDRRAAYIPTWPIREVARPGRTLKAWHQQVLAYFDTNGVSKGGTGAINLIIEKVRRLAHGFRDFTRYRFRILPATSGNRAYRK